MNSFLYNDSIIIIILITGPFVLHMSYQDKKDDNKSVYRDGF